jgi:hypothetical protein
MSRQLIIETIVFLATVYHAIDYHQRGQGLRNSRTSEVLKTLYVNGAMYYLVIIFPFISANLSDSPLSDCDCHPDRFCTGGMLYLIYSPYGPTDP